jgi:hypothetical protein
VFYMFEFNITLISYSAFGPRHRGGGFRVQVN